jgi:hypothetical protein
MNSKSVLSKIMTLLSLENEVNFTDAKDAQGQILQSPTFDIDESVEIVSEDGTKSPAPDGEHEIELTDSEGNKVVIRIETKDGKIVSRENVEEANPADLEQVDEEVVDKEAKIEEELADASTVEAHPLPNTTDEDPRNLVVDDSEEIEKDPLITLGYRIDEMETKLKGLMEKMESAYPEEGAPEVSSLDPTELAAEDEEEELPKLDGAPLETKLSADHLHTPNNYGKKVGSPQGSFLSKLYR